MYVSCCTACAFSPISIFALAGIEHDIQACARVLLWLGGSIAANANCRRLS